MLKPASCFFELWQSKQYFWKAAGGRAVAADARLGVGAWSRHNAHDDGHKGNAQPEAFHGTPGLQTPAALKERGWHSFGGSGQPQCQRKDCRSRS